MTCWSQLPPPIYPLSYQCSRTPAHYQPSPQARACHTSWPPLLRSWSSTRHDSYSRCHLTWWHGWSSHCSPGWWVPISAPQKIRNSLWGPKFGSSGSCPPISLTAHGCWVSHRPCHHRSRTWPRSRRSFVFDSASSLCLSQRGLGLLDSTDPAWSMSCQSLSTHRRRWWWFQCWRPSPIWAPRNRCTSLHLTRHLRRYCQIQIHRCQWTWWCHLLCTCTRARWCWDWRLRSHRSPPMPVLAGRWDASWCTHRFSVGPLVYAKQGKRVNLWNKKFEWEREISAILIKLTGCMNGMFSFCCSTMTWKSTSTLIPAASLSAAFWFLFFLASSMRFLRSSLLT